MKLGPAPRLVAALLLCALPFPLALWAPGLERLGWAALAVVGLLVVVDALFSPKPSAFEPELRLPPLLSLAEPQTLTLSVRNRAGSRMSIQARVVLPEEWKTDRLVKPLELAPWGTSEAVWSILPARRGRYAAGPVFLRVPSPLGFLRKDLRWESTGRPRRAAGASSAASTRSSARRTWSCSSTPGAC
jgi:uncharacterized protein (DUF58 family)